MHRVEEAGGSQILLAVLVLGLLMLNGGLKKSAATAVDIHTPEIEGSLRRMDAIVVRSVRVFVMPYFAMLW
jgi:acyl-CoA synthetase (NDP forming)